MSRRRMFSQSLSGRSSKMGGMNATFLTECSFGVAHDRLVQVITDVQPFEPYWDQLAAVDLSGKNLDSVARLKEFLPRLDSLTLYVRHPSVCAALGDAVPGGGPGRQLLLTFCITQQLEPNSLPERRPWHGTHALDCVELVCTARFVL